MSDVASGARTFLLVTVAGALTSWEIGFEYGAFETLSYRRVFAVFVVSTVVLVATLVADDDTFATSATSRTVLALPAIYIVADMTFLTMSQTIVDLLSLAVLLTFPYAIYVIAKLVDTDYFQLARRQQVIAAVTVIVIGLAGLYVGDGHDRFLSCSDFERIGDYQPSDCIE